MACTAPSQAPLALVEPAGAERDGTI